MRKEDFKKLIMEIIDKSDGILKISITPEEYGDKIVTKLEIVLIDF